MQWNFGDILLTTLAIFVWAALIWMFILVFGDIFRRRDLSGVAKAGWVFLIVILPFVGCLIYLIARPPWEPRQEIPRTGVASARTSPTRDSTPPTRSRRPPSSRPPGPSRPRSSRAIQEQALARAAGG